MPVARNAGCEVAYLPGLAMRRIADLYPGEAQTNAKDARSSRTPPAPCRTSLRSLELTDEITAEITVLTRLRPGPRRQGHPRQQPNMRPARPVPPQPRVRARPATGPPRRHLAPRTPGTRGTGSPQSPHGFAKRAIRCTNTASCRVGRWWSS
ncbi:transposase [Streptomyces sp. NPDC091682]|uniref:IS110 family transposase n=1 Tax=Streptomyces sp. NPDC091682 TaxID=3366005 RepID=UPI00380C8E01